MTRLLDSTLAQLTTAFATAARLDTRTHFEVPTIQMVYVALVELQERRQQEDTMKARMLSEPVGDLVADTEATRERHRAIGHAVERIVEGIVGLTIVKLEPGVYEADNPGSTHQADTLLGALQGMVEERRLVEETNLGYPEDTQ